MNFTVKIDTEASATGVAASRISAEEMERRREALRRAYGHNRIEGLSCGSQADEVFQSFVRGEIELREVGSRIDALHPRV
jgi:hypothetical protein